MSAELPTYSVDLESYYDKEVSIKILGPRNYLWHPKTEIYLLSVHGPKGTWCGRPEDFDYDEIADARWCSHNASFDALAYERLKEVHPTLRWPDPLDWVCTADLGVYCGAGRELKTAAKHLLQVEVSKAYRNIMLGRYPRDLSEAEMKQVTDAGVADAVNCWKIWDQYSPRWPEHERKLSLITRQMSWRGVHIDAEKLREYKKLLTELLWAAEQKIPWAGEKDEKGKPIPLLSAKMVAEHCRKENIPAPVSMSKDDEDFIEWLETYDEQFPWVRAVSEYRRINTTAERVSAMLARLQPNGRMGYGLRYGGAHTLRWAGDGGLNMQNQLRLPLFISKARTVIRDAKEVQQLVKLHEAGERLPEDVLSAIDTRSLIIAPPGKELYIPDLSQIEPRCLWFLTDDQVSMTLAATGMSPYEVHARASMAWTGGRLKDEDKKKYNLAKARCLAAGYGCGWLKFVAMVRQYGIEPQEVFDDPVAASDVRDFERYLQALKNKDQWLHYSSSDETHKRWYCNSWLVINDYRASNPKLAGEGGLWKRLDYSFKISRGRDYEIELPSGRCLRYRNVSGQGGWTAEVISSKTGQLTRTRFYGGKLCENLTQSTARDVFAEAKLRLVEAGFTPVLSVHDELVLEIDEGAPVEPILKLMTQTPTWLPGCPLSAEGERSKFYCK